MEKTGKRLMRMRKRLAAQTAEAQSKQDKQGRHAEKHVLQAYLKVDLEWTSILLYDSKDAALAGLQRLKRLEPAPKHLLRVRKWDGEEISTQVERVLQLARYTLEAVAA